MAPKTTGGTGDADRNLARLAARCAELETEKRELVAQLEELHGRIEAMLIVGTHGRKGLEMLLNSALERAPTR